jgi:hypothetical protein
LAAKLRREIRRESFPPYLSNMERLDELFELIIQRLMQLFLRDCAAKFFAGGTAAVTSVINPAIPSVPNSNLWCSTALQLVAAHAALSLLWLWREARVREQIEVLLVFAVREKVHRKDIHPLRRYVTVCCARRLAPGWHEP